MVSSLLNKLANYTNLSQGVVEHEEDEDSRRREIKVPMLPSVWIAVLEFSSWRTRLLPDFHIKPTLFLHEAWPVFIFLVLCLNGPLQSPVLLGDPQTWVRKKQGPRGPMLAALPTLRRCLWGHTAPESRGGTKPCLRSVRELTFCVILFVIWLWHVCFLGTVLLWNPG